MVLGRNAGQQTQRDPRRKTTWSKAIPKSKLTDEQDEYRPDATGRLDGPGVRFPVDLEFLVDLFSERRVFLKQPE